MKDINQRLANLSPAKRALLEQQLQKKALKNKSENIISRRINFSEAPLSFSQEPMWLLDQLEPGNPAYNRPTNISLIGKLNVALLEQSLNEIIRRHEILRTSFEDVNGKPFQKINQNITLKLPIVELSHLNDENKEIEVQKLAIEEAQQTFDLTQAPLLKAKLVRLHEQKHILLLTMHHIVFDGWSVGVLLKEFAAIYEAFLTDKPSPLPELAIQYADFAIWQRQQQQTEKLESQLSYWKNQLGGKLPVLELPTDRARAAVQTFRGGKHSLLLPNHLVASLKALSLKENVTLFMTLLAAFQILLYRYTSEEDIIVGTPIANRDRVETEKLIGVFINTLVLRNKLNSNLTFTELLAQVRQVALGAYTHQDVPFEKLVEELKPERNLSHHPLFQILFQLRNLPEETIEVQDLKFDSYHLETGTSLLDLSLEIEEKVEGLLCVFKYNIDLFEAPTIERMAIHFQTLLEGIVENPQQKIYQLPLLSESERHQLLIEWNNTATDYPRDKCIHQLFEEQVKQNPDTVAVVFEDEQLTYQQLNQRANQLARHLQTLGVKPEVLVGICVERSIEMVVGLLGILKAGGAYVPLDPNYPQERISLMLADSGVEVLLTQNSLLASLPLKQARVVCLDTDWQEIEQHNSQENLNSEVIPDNLAYVIYTSGSTGKPKGVAVEHLSLCNLSTSHINSFDVGASSNILQFASMSFDVSVSEIFMALTGGARLILAAVSELMPGSGLKRILHQYGVTHMKLPPSVLAVFPYDEFPKLTHMIVGGEACSMELVNQWSTNRRFFNPYGPTESTVHATVGILNNDIKKVTIGRPINNIKIYILDKYFQPVPIGVPGELYIGGDGLARGYLNRPELTKEKFIPNPFTNSTSERLYKTGDLVRYLPDGNIEFIGRIDNQVKIRGFRIELGEIESLLNTHPQVNQAVVIDREDIPGNKRLVAYVVTSDESLTTKQLREFIKSKLPEYMVPSAFVSLDKLPLTPNGKVDRKALPALDSISRENEYAAPRSQSEETIANIFASVLRVQNVGINDNFFELGGNSLLATQLISRMREAFSLEIPLRTLFESPTVAQLDQTLIQLGNSNQLSLPPIQPRSSDEQLPLSWAQERLWFIYQLEGSSATYNISRAFHISGNLNVDALQKALSEIVNRHQVLRTSFQTVNGKAIQVIDSETTININVVDLVQLPPTESENVLNQQIQQEAITPFDLEIAPLIKCILYKLKTNEYVLLLTMHHIVSDGWSIGVLIKELSILYKAFTNKEPSPLPELPIQYADFAVWQRKYLSGEILETQLNYWKQKLDGSPQKLDFPTDYPRPSVMTFKGRKQCFEFDSELTKKLKNLTVESGATLYMTLITAFKILLFYYSNQKDILVRSPIANRNRNELEPLIGFFVNTLVLRTDLSGNPTFIELLSQLQKNCLQAYEHQDVPFQQLIAELNLQRDPSLPPLTQIAFSFENTLTSSLLLPNLTISGFGVFNQVAKTDLTLYMKENKEVLTGTFEYNTNLFKAETINEIIHNFRQLIETIIVSTKQPISEIIRASKLLVPSKRVNEQNQEENWYKNYINSNPITFYGRTALKQTTKVERVSYDLGFERTQKIKNIHKQEDISGKTQSTSLFTIFLTLLAVYLYRISGNRKLVIGIPLSNRRLKSFKQTIGSFMQIVPLVIEIQDRETIVSLITQISRTSFEALQYGQYVVANSIEQPIYDVILNYHNEDFFDVKFNEIQTKNEAIHTGYGYESLGIRVIDFGSSGNFVIDFDFHCDVFDEPLRTLAAQHFLQILDSFLEDREQLVDCINLLSPTEKQKLLVEFNQTQADYPVDKCIHQLFEQQVEQTPNAVAIEYAGQKLTYRELNTRANQLAHYLRSVSVRTDELVGIFVERSVEMLVGLLGILKAGAAYVPLDPAYPAERLAYIIGDAQVSVLLTQSKWISQLPENQARVVCLDSDWQKIALCNRDNPDLKNTGENLAYVIYTSGSTGKPKGVTITHSSLSIFTESAISEYHITNGDRVLQFASINFDAAVEEIYPCLRVGGTIILRSEEMLADARTFFQACQNLELTVLDLPTAYWHQLVSQLANTDVCIPESLRLIVIGGEKVLIESVRIWLQYVKQFCKHQKLQLINTYGPTETTVSATLYKIGLSNSLKLDEIPIGHPLSHVKTYILDKHLQPVPIGVVGELHIGGESLAKGYLNREELTNERFISNPFSNSKSERLYKTGDLARYLPDGNIEFLGRIDNQVKIRGFRIELGEIESVINTHPQVNQAVVIDREDIPGNKRLVAYLVTSDESLTTKQLREFIKSKLPEYMVPSAFVTLDKLPLTPNGKVDRKALPAPDISSIQSENNFVPPNNPTEEILANIWADVLSLKKVGIHDNFFELGGHSLLATQVISRARQAFSVEISLKSLFEKPTVTGLSDSIQTLLWLKESQEVSIDTTDTEMEEIEL